MYIGDEGVWTIFGKVRKDGAEKKTIVATGGVILTAFDLLARREVGRRDRPDAAAPAPRSSCSRHEAPVPRRLTTSNPWLAGVRLAPQEVVKFKARDGLALEGMLIRPLDEKAGAKSPLILTVHGGPEAHYRNGWLTGYSEPGPARRRRAAWRSSTRTTRLDRPRRGVLEVEPADAAGKEFDDLVDAVDHLVAAGLADRAKVGITGGSYGGYATAWCSTRYSDRFAAGVMFVGISDMVSKAGTTDIPNEEYLVHSRKCAVGRLEVQARAQPDLLRRQVPDAAPDPATARTTRACTRPSRSSSIGT